MKKNTLIDPRTRYKHTPFQDQDQDTPALQNYMLPEPDCGESTYEGSSKLVGRKALITGGDSGIGRAAAIAFAREGSDVAFQYFPGEEVDAAEVLALIEQAGVKGFAMALDLRETGAATKLIQETVSVLGGLDLLVLNAAQQIAQTSLIELSIEQVQDTFQINVISMFEAVKAAEPHLETGSSLILTTSVQAFDPSEDLLDYAASKAANRNLVVSLAKYFAKDGIRVNGVAPGPIWTPLQLDEGQPEGEIPDFGQHSLLGRAGQPAELAQVFVFLASNDASYVTAQIYGVTGGQPIT